MDYYLILAWLPAILSIVGVFLAGSFKKHIRRAGFEIGAWACLVWIWWAWARVAPELIVTNIVMFIGYVRAVWNNTEDDINETELD